MLVLITCGFLSYLDGLIEIKDMLAFLGGLFIGAALGVVIAGLIGGAATANAISELHEQNN